MNLHSEDFHDLALPLAGCRNLRRWTFYLHGDDLALAFPDRVDIARRFLAATPAALALGHASTGYNKDTISAAHH